MRWKKSLPESLEIEGRALPVEWRRNPRARRMILRVDSSGGGLQLTLPPGASEGQAADFLERHHGWIAARLKKLPETIPFAPGAAVPVLGIPHRIQPAPWARRGVWRESGLLYVSGTAEHLARRVGDYLKAEARRACSARALEKATAIGAKITRVSVRETRSRWGSCSSSGSLSFSWRLILAPEAVLDYVVAHEVAHLRHLDHSPAFWRLVAELAPDFEAQRRWLKREGAGLWRYG
jgi:predicted metal-dependent hydrolase